MLILLVGSTGIVGGQIARRLREGGNQTRALVRGGGMHPKARQLQDAGIEIVNGDLTSPETLGPACQGVDVVVTTATSMPAAADDGLRRVDHEGALALIEAAERAGVKKFIYTSYSGNIRAESPLETAKRECENRLLQGPMQVVILRPSYFMEMWLSPVLGFDPANGSARIYGSGEGKGNYISGSDVAKFAVAALTKPYVEKNTILEMGGPDALSQLDAVHIFEQALGKKIELNLVPEDAIRAQHGSSDPLQRTFGALMLGYCKGDVIQGARSVAEQHGITLRSVADYAADLRAQQLPNVA
jgi:uncharacterized protein YbjT (DUF2867 family)